MSETHKYKLVALGGTFDRFHRGHETLLTKAFSIGDSVIIGITDQSMTGGKKFSRIIDPYLKRKKEVELFLQKHRWSRRARIVMLRDPLGPLKTDKKIQAVVVGPRVSEDIISQIRTRVPVIYCKTITSEDGSYLSSTRIRRGEIDRNGAIYSIPKQDLLLPLSIRSILKKPLGNMVYDTGTLETRYAPLIVSVGDATTKRLVDDELYVDLSIVDLRTGRKPSPYSLEELGITKETHRIYTVENPAGKITRSLFANVDKALNELSVDRSKPRAIIVTGEEDLAVLPALYCAPLMSFVWYGQPRLSKTHSEGLVGVEVTELVKKNTANLLSKFKRA